MGHAEIAPEHILRVHLSKEEGIVVPLVKKLGADPGGLTRELDRHRGARPAVSGDASRAALSPATCR